MKNKIVGFAVFLIFGLFAALSITGASKAEACANCSYASWSQLCAQKFLRSGYRGNLGYICEPINSAPALQCISRMIDYGYNNLSRNITNACAWTTVCGADALETMFSLRFSAPPEFLKTIASANTWTQSNCYKHVFRNYTNLTPQNVRALCPN